MARARTPETNYAYPVDDYTKDLRRNAHLFVDLSGPLAQSRDPPHRVLDFHKLQHLLHQLKKTGVEELADNGVDRKRYDLTPKWVVENWRYVGVNSTDITENAYRNAERTLAVVATGEYKLHNIWGETAVGTKYLWFLVCEVPVNDVEGYSPMSTVNTKWETNEYTKDNIVDPRTGLTITDKRFTHVVRLVPIVTSERRVPYFCEEHQPEDALGNKTGFPTCKCGQRLYCVRESDGKCVHRYGYPIYVGQVERGTNKRTIAQKAPLVNTLSFMTLPKMDVWTDTANLIC